MTLSELDDRMVAAPTGDGFMTIAIIDDGHGGQVVITRNDRRHYSILFEPDAASVRSWFKRNILNQILPEVSIVRLHRKVTIGYISNITRQRALHTTKAYITLASDFRN
jgi:hypothetical protein